jgi:hypothetical protein
MPESSLGFARIGARARHRHLTRARVAAFYQGYWFYIDEADSETKSTYSLLVKLSRLHLQTNKGDKPLLTLPLSR